ncbi:unnamed protein product [Brachionus calyciflorus]|uniref:Chitinase n=1 Tax=Brachionus calyciflorus TaxID=104777 RepID=A0A814BYM4_9BILA|nr:unnamed protein product [Brachionus calyciflorus]
MVWTIDFDDFKGTFCGQGDYPLMTILNEVLKDSQCFASAETTQITTESTEIITVSTEEISTTESTTASTTSTENWSTDSTSESTTSFDVTSTESTTIETTSELLPEFLSSENSETVSPTTETSTETTISESTTDSTIVPYMIPDSTASKNPLETESTIFSNEPLTSGIYSETSTSKSAIVCNGEDFVQSLAGCEYYQVCLKGFSEPMATLKCPENYWFDSQEATCVQNKPAHCDLSNAIVPYMTTESTSTLSSIGPVEILTTLVPIVSDDTTIFVYVTPETTTQTSTLVPMISDDTTLFIYVTPETTTQTSTAKTTSAEILTEAPTTKSTVYLTSKIQSTLTTLQTTRKNPTVTTIRTQTTQRRTQTTTQKPYQSSTKYQENYSKKFVCPEPSGLFQNTNDCKSFWHCSNSVAYEKKCPGNLFFDNKLKTCAWSSDSCNILNQNNNVLILQDKKLTRPPYTQPPNAFVCPKPNGFFENNKNCRTFYQCVRNVPYLKNCSGNLVFNEKFGVCDFKSSCNDKRN